jgi:hypothetical protein
LLRHKFDIFLDGVTPSWYTRFNTTNRVDFSTFECYSFSLSECYQNIIIQGNDTAEPVLGMFETWFPLQSVLISTLECLCNDTCLSQIEQLINSTVSPSYLTRLHPFSSSSIETLANQLFIQSWNNHSSFDSYFHQCHPLTCQYTVHTRLNIVYIITRILGLIGGIEVVLRLFLGLFVRLIFQLFHTILRRDATLPSRGRQRKSFAQTMFVIMDFI